MGGRSSAVVPLCYSFVSMLVFSQCFFFSPVPSSSGWWQFMVAKAEVAQHFLVVLYWVLNRNFGDLEEITFRSCLCCGESRNWLSSVSCPWTPPRTTVRWPSAETRAPETPTRPFNWTCSGQRSLDLDILWAPRPLDTLQAFIPMRTCSALALGISPTDKGTSHFNYFLFAVAPISLDSSL